MVGTEDNVPAYIFWFPLYLLSFLFYLTVFIVIDVLCFWFFLLFFLSHTLLLRGYPGRASHIKGKV